MVAHAMQEVIDAAGAGLLPAALGQTLPGSGQGAEQKQEQEAGSSLELLEQRAALVQGSLQCWRGGAAQPQGCPLVLPCIPVSWLLLPSLLQCCLLVPTAAETQPHIQGAPGASPFSALGHSQHHTPRGAGTAAPRTLPPARAITAPTQAPTSSQMLVPAPALLPCSGTRQLWQTPSPHHQVPKDNQ